MNDHETKYAQVDKELLAVTWALERLDTLVYGRKLIVKTDHKPLLGLVKKPMVHMSPRQQRFVARLMRYDFELLYVPGRELVAADFLSRAVTKHGPECRCKMMGTDLELESAFVSMLSNLDMTDDVRTKCVKAREKDACYRCAVTAFEKGWPGAMKDNCGEFWSHRNELTVEDDLLFHNGRMVIPREARKEVLSFLHRGHVGMSTMQKRAEAAAWWPGMRNEIKKWVERCGECQISRPQQMREPMQSFETPQAPGLVVHADYFELSSYEYVILVDGFSGWTEVMSANNRRPGELCRIVRLYMTRNGVPKIFHSDQGSAFEAREFDEFCEKWGIIRSSNSPKHPRGNGIAEAHVKKVKHLLTTSRDEDDLARALLALMQTPVAVGKPTPAELHFGRNVRDELHPVIRRTETGWDKHRQWRDEKNAKEKKYFDRGTRELKELSTGDAVLVWHRDEWQRGKVTQKLARPRSYEVELNETGRRLERNRVQLRAIGHDVSEPSMKSLRPFPFFQQRTEIPSLNETPEQNNEEEDAEGTDHGEDTDDELQNIGSDGSGGESDGELSGDDSEEGEEFATPEPDQEPSDNTGFRTRQGRNVRAPRRYTPSDYV